MKSLIMSIKTQAKAIVSVLSQNKIMMNWLGFLVTLAGSEQKVGDL